MAIVLIRTLIVYFSLLLILRLLGKRQLGEMELSEFVVAALIADLAAHPLQDIGIPMLNGLVPILTLFGCEVLISGLSMKSIRLRALLFGKPSVLIFHGKIRQAELKKNRFTVDELLQELRGQGVTDPGAVASAVLETDGRLNVLPYASQSPPTAEALRLPVKEGGLPVIVISDGRTLEDNLRLSGHDKAWLTKQLRQNGYAGAKEVFLMTVNEAGEIYLAGKEDRP